MRRRESATTQAQSTVRSHLKQAMEKAGVDRQADLIRVLLALPVRERVFGRGVVADPVPVVIDHGFAIEDVLGAVFDCFVHTGGATDRPGIAFDGL